MADFRTSRLEPLLDDQELGPQDGPLQHRAGCNHHKGGGHDAQDEEDDDQQQEEVPKQQPKITYKFPKLFSILI